MYGQRYGTLTISESTTINAGEVYTADKLVVNSGKKLTVNGTLNVKGDVTVNGNITRAPLKTPARRHSGSFAAYLRCENLEIHKVFLRFSPSICGIISRCASRPGFLEVPTNNKTMNLNIEGGNTTITGHFVNNATLNIGGVAQPSGEVSIGGASLVTGAKGTTTIYAKAIEIVGTMTVNGTVDIETGSVTVSGSSAVLDVKSTGALTLGKGDLTIASTADTVNVVGAVTVSEGNLVLEKALDTSTGTIAVTEGEIVVDGENSTENTAIQASLPTANQTQAITKTLSDAKAEAIEAINTAKTQMASSSEEDVKVLKPYLNAAASWVTAEVKAVTEESGLAEIMGDGAEDALSAGVSNILEMIGFLVTKPVTEDAIKDASKTLKTILTGEMTTWETTAKEAVDAFIAAIEKDGSETAVTNAGNTLSIANFKADIAFDLAVAEETLTDAANAKELKDLQDAAVVFMAALDSGNRELIESAETAYKTARGAAFALIVLRDKLAADIKTVTDAAAALKGLEVDTSNAVTMSTLSAALVTKLGDLDLTDGVMLAAVANNTNNVFAQGDSIAKDGVTKDVTLVLTLEDDSLPFTVSVTCVAKSAQNP